MSAKTRHIVKITPVPGIAIKRRPVAQSGSAVRVGGPLEQRTHGVEHERRTGRPPTPGSRAVPARGPIGQKRCQSEAEGPVDVGGMGMTLLDRWLGAVVEVVPQGARVPPDRGRRDLARVAAAAQVVKVGIDQVGMADPARSGASRCPEGQHALVDVPARVMAATRSPSTRSDRVARWAGSHHCST